MASSSPFSYTFQTLSTWHANVPNNQPSFATQSLLAPSPLTKQPSQQQQPTDTLTLSQNNHLSLTPPLGSWEALTANFADKTANVWVALDVLEPMVNNFQGILSLKNGLLLSALVPVVNLPLQEGNRQLLSDSPWGRITEALLTAAIWIPLLYSGSKEILTTTLETYQQAEKKTRSKKTAEAHATNKGITETALQTIGLVIGPYALMNLSDFIIGESFYRSRGLFSLSNKTFPDIMATVKNWPEFLGEHDFIDEHDLTNPHQSFTTIREKLAAISKYDGALSPDEKLGLRTKALFRRYNRQKMTASRFLPELWVTLTRRMYVMAIETWKQIPMVLRNQMPGRIDSTRVLAEIGERLVREDTQAKLKSPDGVPFQMLERIRVYMGTQEFKLGSYKTLSSLTLLTLWYLCLDPFINKLANSLLTPWLAQQTNRRLAKKGEPPFFPKGVAWKAEDKALLYTNAQAK